MRLLSTLVLVGMLATNLVLAQPGSDCSNAVPITTGTYTAPSDNFWYSFVPDSTGNYYIHTCGLSTCDTKVWVYSYCNGLTTDEGWLNALAYNDDVCNLQSQVQVTMTAGQTYFIRIGDYQDACVNGGSLVTWEIFIPQAPPPANCNANEVPVTVIIEPDAFPNDTHWQLQDGNGNVLTTGSATGAEICVDTNLCVVFTITDDYGDGIQAPGGYWLYYDGIEVGHASNFGDLDRVEMHCPVGFSCTQAETITEGTYTAPSDDYWYSFTPVQTGLYDITTCGTNTCDTKIWVYDHCTGLMFDETNIGTIYYDDNDGGCGLQAKVTAILEDSTEYWIRIGDANDACSGLPIEWTLTYAGQIPGCMDINSCNYNPLAQYDDGSCIPWGDPNCPQGPDLVAIQPDLVNSISVSSLVVNPNDCYIDEGCLTGYGTRELIRFTTHIQNQGSADYYIGSPSTHPDQFVFSPCHNHWHYQGYAEYVLYDVNAQQVMQGYKNGFCVLDLECWNGGNAQYGCGNMGISVGCGDIYGSGLDCQWIDITGVPEGLYTLVVRVNWDNSPDALGHYEMSHTNNWAQACIYIDRTPSLSVTVDTNCNPYVDCAGEVYGSAQLDCDGVCNGTRLIGDLDADVDQDIVDAQNYVSEIIGSSITPLPCNDANDDGSITVTDAALVNRCATAHANADTVAIDAHCDFPALDIVNIYDTVTFSIGDLNMVDGYMDIHMKNPNKRILGYELTLSGVEIASVTSLADAVEYPITPAYMVGGDRIIGLSYEDSTIARSNSYQPLCRVYFTNPGSQICIANVVDVVNEDYNNSLTFLENACVVVSGLNTQAVASGVRVFPNPFREETVLLFNDEGSTRIELLDLQGRNVRTYADVKGGRCVIRREGLAAGTYMYRMSGAVNAMGRLVVE